MSKTIEDAPNELLAACAAAEICDGDLVFVGVGTNGRAFTLSVGIPLVSVRLAQLTHAPSAAVYWGNLLEPDLSTMPSHLKQSSLTRWKAAASPADVGYKCDLLMRRGFAVSFDSAAQIDRFGNLNITMIGEPGRGGKRLVGCLAQPEHLAFVARPIVIMDLNRRSFVDRVDYITSVGHARDGRSRAELGLGPGGPHRVLTDKAVFDFETPDRTMRLRSLHPGVSLEEVLDELAFRPALGAAIARTATPTGRQQCLIRDTIDPDRVMLRV